MMRIASALLSVGLLAGCGGKEPIPQAEADEIAAMSQDADRYQDRFAAAIRDLSAKDDCQASAMRDNGGFSRVTGENFYFIYCGEPMNSNRRWYYSPFSGTLSRIKAEM